MGQQNDRGNANAAKPQEPTPAASQAANASPAQPAAPTLESLAAERDALARQLAERDTRLAALAASGVEAQAATDRLRADHAEVSRRLESSERLAESQMHEIELLTSRLRAADTDRAESSRVTDRLRALAEAAGLGHLPTLDGFLDALLSRVGKLREMPGSGFGGVKRFHAHTTVIGKSKAIITLAPGDEIPDDVNIDELDPKLITVS